MKERSKCIFRLKLNNKKSATPLLQESALILFCEDRLLDYRINIQSVEALLLSSSFISSFSENTWVS